MAKIHPTAVVEDGAILADGVEIGPLCYVGPHVKIGEGTRLIAHCNVDGYTTLGKNNTLHPFAALGQPAQDHSVVPGAATYLNVGDNNIFREGTAIHTGTAPESATNIGNNNMFMNGSHVAHNCQIGNDVHFISMAVVGGYGEVHDRAILSGLVAIHQFCRVGKLAIISGCSAFSKDVPPFMMAEGRNGGVKMINKVGLQRAGYTAEQINIVKQIFRIYYRSGLIPSIALEKIRTELPQTAEVKEFLDFCANSKKGVIPGNANSGHRD
ncbi:MAG: acyl-ACP--UDP-N-acetylglucosamine O-acyltransferase [Lentisphaerae bacterium]|nr:acyl-ACP--UDP-N-acetylglucosamine O-acyltransferase [Lentisphaerota bacterium]